MRAVPLTWVLQKNGLASSKSDARQAIINGDVLVSGVRATDLAMRLPPGDYLLQRNGTDGGEVRVRVGS